ncbi:MAG: alpha/beta hydrolase [Cytophagaceae bacterium]|nr:alpha/beta hydrolase [Cytophagaceae bacterium]
MRRLKKPLLLLFVLANIYAILCGGLYFFQENLIFHPSPLPTSYSFDFESPFEEVTLEAQQARLHGIHFTQPQPKGVILYFHGNAGNLARWGELVQPLVAMNYAVIVMDYRQFGKSSGALSQESLYQDALQWYAFAKAQYDNTPITLYGRSLGTTFATYVASKNEGERLILETPFYSIANEAKSRFPFLPVDALVKYPFPTYSFINEVTAPITIVHGTADGVVDYSHGKRLYEHINSDQKELITIPEGGHNNLSDYPTYQQALYEMLE